MSRPVTLTQRDLQAIRAIVREEIEDALAAEKHKAREADIDALPDEDVSVDNAGWRQHYEELKRKRNERAARPIPNTPFVDIYDARRLLNEATRVTANAWIRRGRLTRHKIDGCLQFSRAEIDAILAASTKRSR
jgi:hypothetical protein